MRANRASGFVFLTLVALLSASSSAHAWTRTVVQSARATVEIERGATVYVLLRLDIEVNAGWLHELELVDLGEDVELDRYRPPYFRSEDGDVFRPEAELHDDGRIRLWFSRREAPRRGEYRVYMRYRTRADASAIEVGGEPRVRVVWSVPAWETGLHDVAVELRAPKGSSVPAEMHETSPGMTFDVIERPKRTVVKWRRIHLPRTTAWPLTVDAPAGSITLPVSEVVAERPDGFRPLENVESRPIAWGAVLLALLVLLKRRQIEIRFGRDRLALALGWPTTLAASAGLVGLVQWLDPGASIWVFSLLALVLHKPVRRGAPSGSVDPRPVSRSELRSVAPIDPLDATTPAGASFLALVGVGLLALGDTTAALSLIPVFTLGTRHHRPPTNARALILLEDFVQRLTLDEAAPPMCFSWTRSDQGAPRVRIHLPNARAGLRSLSFVATSDRLDHVHRHRVMLCVETRAQSDADDLVRRRTAGTEEARTVDNHAIRCAHWDADAVELLRALARKAPKPVKASRGTWLLREISEPKRKAA